jgi:hypothetical protein
VKYLLTEHASRLIITAGANGVKAAAAFLPARLKVRPEPFRAFSPRREDFP